MDRIMYWSTKKPLTSFEEFMNMRTGRRCTGSSGGSYGLDCCEDARL